MFLAIAFAASINPAARGGDPWPKPDDREAIIARVEMGCSYEALAVALGKPSGAAA